MPQCFAVPTKEDTSKKTQLLCNLKCLMATLEDELTPKVEPVCYTPVCMTTCVPCCHQRCQPCCPPCCPTCCPVEEEPQPPVECPDILVCYKCKTDKPKKRTSRNVNNGKELCESKSRELRGGILYIGCDCEKKNGLQDNCPRTGCQGSPECLVSPPICLPSRYANGKHLEKKMMKGNNKYQMEYSEDEGMDSCCYQCFGADVKVPDQQICIMMPSAGCCPPCNGRRKQELC